MTTETKQLALSAGAIVFLMMFPAFTKDVAASQKVLSNLPLAVREALGISLKNFFTIYGFFAYLFGFLCLAGAVQGMNLGVSALSKEQSGKTVDFLLTKPVSRMRVITSKLLAALTSLVIVNIVFSFIATVDAKLVSTDSFDAKIFLMISITMFFIQLFFLVLGTFFSVIIPRIKSVISVSLPTVFIFFIIGTLGAIIGNENVRYLTPFKFYDPTYIINHGAYEMRFVIVEVLFIIVTILASYIIYINKDIRAVS